ncbi:hypothetical protein SAMN05444722_1779 [Rhodovulum sp. ES.010]|uniref:DUF6152 family protein n=1 Tax=Rhodovulum sp. ES.010 TaxID=1882821 RepID=UPI00092AE953|nr:DUF6152 family protein [Rhodovulum sp. ES.010]SIO38043.1 hypothetical protein SAMN05444722_1779 [Rhodovulum sp. ES.010]
MRHTRRAVIGTALALALSVPALAHHGWRWTSGDNIELTGIIVEARLGNPHGELRVEAGDETWTVEVGQPWRNARAGLADDDLSPGVEATFVGEPASEMSRRVMKAERIRIGGTLYDLYPGRD